MFTHLHVHTEYSPLDGASHLHKLVARAAADGQLALAITDHGNIGAAWAFQQECEAAGVKPIIGCEVYLAIGSRFERDSLTVEADDSADFDAASAREKTKRYYHLTLIAQNTAGWHSLNRILVEAEQHVWSHPRIDYDLLAANSEGLIVLTGCLGGPVLGNISTAVSERSRVDMPDVPAGLLPDADELVKEMAELDAVATPDEGSLEQLELRRSQLELARTELNSRAAHPFFDAYRCAIGHERAADEAEQRARQALEAMIAAVGHDNVYVEVMEHDIAAESAALPAMAALAEEYGLPLVATNDSHYTAPEDAATHEAILAMQSGKALDDPKRFHFHGAGYHLRTEAEMRALRPEPWWQTACDNTALVADRVQPRVLPKARMRLPKYPVPDGFADEMAYLHHLVARGARTRYGNPLPDDVRQRLRTEMSVIGQMGFPAYFLIVHDMIRWAKDHGIIVGPGRGSAAGSLVSYCLDIVTIDPLRHNLLFERFLEPGRKGMPDIDTDFEKARFNEVYDWAQRTYGHESVARIGTFAIATTKRAIKDAARVHRLSGLGDRLSKAVPVVGGKPYTFTQLADEDDLKGEKYRTVLQRSGADGAQIVDLAEKYANTIAGTSVHACGVIISGKPLVGNVPLRIDAKEATEGRQVFITQWTGPELEELGLLKMDMLRIRNLDVIAKAIEYIEATTGEHIDYYDLPDPDTQGDPRVAAAWQLLREGRTAGVFQMDSDGMRKLTQQVQPTNHEDLTAILALYRPGPMGAGMHETYARRKTGREAVDYSYLTDDPDEARWIDTVLGETYGVFVYQEELMRLGTVVAGFDAAMRSKLRKAVGKKKRALLDEVFTALRDGAGRQFTDASGTITSPVFQAATVERLIDTMQGAASYLFNKSHAAAYAQVSFNTAYLKANWPAAYGAALLACTDDDEKRLTAINSLRDEGVAILPPDVNRSRSETFPEDDTSIRLGLGEVKGVGVVGAAVVDGRPQEGYTSLGHLREVLGPALDAGVLEGLICSGACDRFGPRLGMLTVCRALPSGESIDIPAVEFGLLERSVRERDLLGVSLSDNPLARYRSQVKAWRVPGIEDAADGSAMGARAIPVHRIPDAEGARVVVAGVLAGAKERAYSKGQMLSVVIEGGRSSIRGVMWAEDLASQQRSEDGLPPVGSVVAVSARVRVREVEVTDERGEVIDVEQVKELTVMHLWRIPIDEGLHEDRLTVEAAQQAFALMREQKVQRFVDVQPQAGEFSPLEQCLLAPLRKRPVVTVTVCPVCGRHRYITGSGPARCTITAGCIGRPVKALTTAGRTARAPSVVPPQAPHQETPPEPTVDEDPHPAAATADAHRHTPRPPTQHALRATLL
ncbi:DNA polymerase III subunit alpha [Pseudoclavibacter sp. CFCC 13796]|uniref:DNA polymerase III subunit alpha n=1 Tax=Pseudoclavibacter sp. CFCC 13796 TaxID=2615179 RepID=UPI001787AD81|nr:DNA polymerase III subunit alpha [Pseudoclavibacter sp. CFCC 13796]